MKKLLLASLLLFVVVPVAAQVNVSPIQWEPFIGTDPITGSSLVGQGYGCYSVTTVVSLASTPNCAVPGVAIHRLARHATITVETGAVRVRFDATNPTATAGELWNTGTTHTFTDQRALLLAFRMVSTSGTATVTVTYAY